MTALLSRLTPTLTLPATDSEAAATAAIGLRRLLEATADPALAAFIRDVAATAPGGALLNGVLAYSPFLTQCLVTEPEFFREWMCDGPEAMRDRLLAAVATFPERPWSDAALARALRQARRRLALTVALADVAGFWSLEMVTATLTRFAEVALEAAVEHILRGLGAAGVLALSPERPVPDSAGFVVLGMGKLGARELNYSSDIDLILLYDPEKAPTKSPESLGPPFARAARALLRLLEERTADGYVFRVDLRLRPDPGFTPPALTIAAALEYYESVAQNWERAAMIKARPVAGDHAAGADFLQQIQPFVWRRSLDSAAIEAIHGIKHQIDHGGDALDIEGRNIKTGRGGIREIEFYAQTQQLIWGGRESGLRASQTLVALAQLQAHGHISKVAEIELSAAYRFLRTLEHRLQMMEDQQTQTLPTNPEALARVAGFMGYGTLAGFREALLRVLEPVAALCAALFEEESGGAATTREPLIFTGVDTPPATVEALIALGFRDVDSVIVIARRWHQGLYPVAYGDRAQRRLATLTPTLLRVLAKSVDPDAALARFDRLLAGLPAGAQIFSLLAAHPKLLGVLAELLGAAPRLGDSLARRPILLDAMLSEDFFEPLASHTALRRSLARSLRRGEGFQQRLDIIRRWTGDLHFQVGVQLTQRSIDSLAAERAATAIAETVLQTSIPLVAAAFRHRNGPPPGEGLAVVAFGNLGGGALTLGSDLDLIYVYDRGSLPGEADAPAYYTRLCQQIGAVLSAPTAVGSLFQVDARLRPAGAAGALATQFETFAAYYDSRSVGGAWVWEHMALTRARPVFGPPALRHRLAAAIRAILRQRRDPATTAAAVAQMRSRIAAERPPPSPWDARHRPGGLLDVEFVIQCLQITHAHSTPEILSTDSRRALRQMAIAGVLEPAVAAFLEEALSLWRTLRAILGLITVGPFLAKEASEAEKNLLLRATALTTMMELEDRMETTARRVSACFDRLIIDRSV